MFNNPARQQDEIVALLKVADARRVGDIGCGTGILADRIERELHPDEVYGVDVSDGMLSQAKRRSRHVEWLAPAEQLPFEDSTLDRSSPPPLFTSSTNQRRYASSHA